MKRWIACIAFVLLFAFAAGAEEQPKKDVEWSMEVGCQHCHYSEETGIKTCVANCGPAGKYDGKVYFLKGATSKEFGTFRFRSLAVFRLTMSSNLTGCSIGKFAGSAPLNILSTKDALRSHIRTWFGP